MMYNKLYMIMFSELETDNLTPDNVHDITRKLQVVEYDVAKITKHRVYTKDGRYVEKREMNVILYNSMWSFDPDPTSFIECLIDSASKELSDMDVHRTVLEDRISMLKSELEKVGKNKE